MRLSTFSVVRWDYVIVPLFVPILGWQRIVDLGEKFLHVTAKDCLE